MRAISKQIVWIMYCPKPSKHEFALSVPIYLYIYKLPFYLIRPHTYTVYICCSVDEEQRYFTKALNWHLSPSILLQPTLQRMPAFELYVPQPQTRWWSSPLIKELISEQLLLVVPDPCMVNPQGCCTLMSHLKQWCNHHHKGVDTQKTLVCRRTYALSEAQCPCVTTTLICHPKIHPAHYNLLYLGLLRY